MYKRIWYDRNNNNMHIWYVDTNGKHRHAKVKPKIEYFVEDKTGESDHKDIYGNSMKMMTSENSFRMRDFVKSTNARTCETSLSEEVKFLHKHYTKDIKVDMSNLQVATFDIECAMDKWSPPKEAAYPVNLICIHFSRENKYHMFGLHPYTGDELNSKLEYHHCADEETLLKKFVMLFRRMKVDILTGWYSDLFDVPYVINRMKNLGIDIDKYSLSPVNKVIEKETRKQKNTVSGGYEICGISQLDGRSLYMKFEQKKRVSYSLEAIGQIVCKEGKKKYDGNINTIWKTDWNTFCEYNFQDVALTRKIEAKKKYIELSVRFCYGALVPFEKVYSSIAIITGYMLKYLHSQGLLYPDPIKQEKEAYPGGYVMARQGYYRYAVSYDFESLYPNIMMASNIDPSTIVMFPSDEEIENGDLIRTPASGLYSCKTEKGGLLEFEGIWYRQDKRGIIPQVVEKIFGERKYWKNLGKVADGYKANLSVEEIAKNYEFKIDVAKKFYEEVKTNGYESAFCDVQQYVRKILINSFYGVLGTPFFGFYNAKNAAAVTIWGRTIIQYISNEINKYVKEEWHQEAYNLLCERFPSVKQFPTAVKDDVVILIDTDSNYVHLKPLMDSCGLNLTLDEFREFTDIVSNNFFKPMFAKKMDEFAASYNIKKHTFNFKQEKTISQMFVLKKKKYAVEVIAKEGKIYKNPELDITGIEVVRTSTPVFCVGRLKEAIRMLFDKMDKKALLEYIKQTKEDFMKQDIDDITTPSTVNDYDKYAEKIDFNNGRLPKIPLHCPQHVKASIMYNYTINKLGWNDQPISDNSKIKYTYVKKNNILNTEVIAYMGNWDDRLAQQFTVDKETQFYKKFTRVIERFFETLGWGKIILNTNDLENFIQF